jgi:hypothetical protein
LGDDITPSEASWMDAGMLSRWILGGLTSLPDLVREVSPALEEGAARRVRRTLRELGLAPTAPLVRRAGATFLGR